MHNQESPLLLKRLNKIKKFFNVPEILSTNIDDKYVQRYYKENKLAYSIFHSFSGAMHMGISRDGKYKNEDLFEGLKTIEKYITPNTKNILELATGRGVNCYFLAKKHPSINFFGCDISKDQLEFAEKKARKVANYHPFFADYHDLSQLSSNKFDIIFVIESLCHSQKKGKVLSEVKRLLKDNGVLIILDGYLKKSEDTLSSNEKDAAILALKGMGVNHPEEYKIFIKKIEESGFTLILDEDVSEFIIPTLKRFELIANILSAIPITASLMLKVFSEEFTRNGISALLLRTLVEMKIAGYYITVAKKT